MTSRRHGLLVAAALAGAVVAGSLVVAPATAASSSGSDVAAVRATTTTLDPVAPFDDTKWAKGTVGFNSKMVCLAPLNCFTYSAVINRVDYQGTPARPLLVPRVGERFYLHVLTAVVFPQSVDDTYQMRVLLPAGLKPSVLSASDVKCAITDTDNNQTRLMSPAECLDPVQVGLYQQFPPVALSDGEVAHFFFPVVATRPLAGALLQLISDPINNPLTALPDPLLSELEVSSVAGFATAPRSLRAAYPRAKVTTVTWAAPASTGGVVLKRYESRVKRVGTTRWSAWVSTKLVRARTFGSLLKGVRYDVQVRAVNVAGAGAVASLRVKPTR